MQGAHLSTESLLDQAFCVTDAAVQPLPVWAWRSALRDSPRSACSHELKCLAVSQDMLKSLSEEMDESLIPQAYGGQNMLPLYESKQELELRELVKRLNSSAAGGAQAPEPPAKLTDLQTNGN